MWNSATIMMIVEGTFATIYMTLVSTLMAYVIGLPAGVALVVTGKEGSKPNKAVNRILDVLVNVMRSIPFLILLILVIPLTRAIVGKSYGPSATIVPLTLAAAPFIARLVESSLLEVDKGVIEAAQSLGAGIPTIVMKVMLLEARSSLLSGLAIALGTILGYSAMAGAVGGGRPGRHSDPIRLQPVPAGYHDSNSYPARGPGSDHAGHLHEAFQKTGQKDHRITPPKSIFIYTSHAPVPKHHGLTIQIHGL